MPQAAAAHTPPPSALSPAGGIEPDVRRARALDALAFARAALDGSPLELPAQQIAAFLWLIEDELRTAD